MGFWKNVEEELNFRGISRKELSLKSGIPMTTINRAIERDSNPFAEDALKISNILNISLEKLLNLSNTPNSFYSSESENFLKQWSKLSKTQKQKLTDFLESMN